MKKVTGLAAPLPQHNVDTDIIMPKRFLRTITREGLAEGVFADLRFNEDGTEKSEFVLNQPSWRGSTILVVGDNFGCGSSREHAVWALQDYGFSIVIAPSFADIFFSNCFKNGLLPISLDQKIVESLQQETSPIHIDLEKQIIKTSTQEISFEIDSHKKKILLEGLDDIAQTFQLEDKITEFEKNSTVPSVL